jgi:hypothetical protein
MSPDIGELVMAADVVVVPVSGDGDNGLVDQIGELASHAAQSHPGVHDQVTVPPLDVPDVAAHQRDNVRLEYPGHGVIDPCSFEPAAGNGQRRHGFHPSTQSPHDSGHPWPGACLYPNAPPGGATAGRLVRGVGGGGFGVGQAAGARLARAVV